MIQVPVGPVQYTISLVDPLPVNDRGRQCYGLCDHLRQHIVIGRALPPKRRLSTLWHELAHAWHAEMDIHQADKISGEALANLIGMAMASMTPNQIAQLYILMTTGRVSDNIMMLDSKDAPIPVIPISVEYP